MKKIVSSVKSFFTNENGQGMVEYGLIIAVVALVAVVTLFALGGGLKTLFTNANTQLSASSH